MPLVGRREAALHPLQEAVLLELVVVVATLSGQLDRRVDEEGAEDVEDPGELVDRRRADRDEDAAEHEGDDDAHHQRRLLELLRHAELGHDDEEDEEVVDRERVLGQPSRVVLGGELHTGEVPDAEAEDEGQPDVHRERGAGLLVRRHVWPASDDEDVEQQDGRRHPDGQGPDPGGNVHVSNTAFRSRCTGRWPEVSPAPDGGPAPRDRAAQRRRQSVMTRKPRGDTPLHGRRKSPRPPGLNPNRRSLPVPPREPRYEPSAGRDTGCRARPQGRQGPPVRRAEPLV